MMEIVVTLLFLLFTMINVNEIIQKHFAMSGGDFHASVICGGFYKKMFGILTHKFMVPYENTKLSIIKQLLRSIIL